MELLRKLSGEQNAKRAARFMQAVCRLAMVYYLLCLVLSLLGRQQFTLHTPQGTYAHAICAETDHAPHFRALTVTMSDTVHIRQTPDGGIAPAARAALPLLFAAELVPLFFAYLCLSRLFGNVAAGRIFTEENASHLLRFGALQVLTALLVPFFRLLVCAAANVFADGAISIATGGRMLNSLIPGIAFFVAAYIIHYGIGLQDEVDHTL